MPAIQAAWTEADQALWAGVLNFCAKFPLMGTT
jgi:hypothetical protein